ncbi:hypothetical protein CUJ83_07200 [Methanocella sp. CWC-04]|uniref:Restriction endonuclease type IV Mrr domain-containing protein n=1 Tax=Methanooceanicella nereidis TaxID=2052831 RepID=A0AAP2RC34_9EURY|nr:restriction endonuclease [Methanocella sp. CWC-04]MCD1294784.1 hypothetical protein [Methanocella sp. CWC-04]
MSNNLLDVIKEIFSTYNYAVSAGNQGFDLLAKKTNNTVAIKLSDSMSVDELGSFMGSFGEMNAKGLVVTMGYFSEDVKLFAKQHDILLWERPELEMQIGKAVLISFEGKPDPFMETAETASQPAQKKDISAITQELYTRVPEKAEKSSKKLASILPEKAQAKSAAKAEKPEPVIEPQVNEPASEIIEAAAEEEPEDLKIPLHTIPIKVKSTDAIKIAGNIGRAEDVEYSLKFIPFWKYSYNVDVQSKYKDIVVPLKSKGTKIINAINKNVDPAPTIKPVESIDIPDAPYNIEMTILTQEEAQAMAMKSIVDESSKTIRFKATIGEAAMVEHKKFSPKPAEVKFDIELLYIPFWAVRSHKGYIEINAYDGKPSKMPIDDGAEIL